MSNLAHNLQQIPLSQFVAWDGNVRNTGASDNIDELAASISTHGLLQPIVARNNDNGSFSVVAGRRRFLALQHLVKAGKFAEDAPIACTIIDNSCDYTEISLVENVMQLPMHPADKFEAFRVLADKGMAVADIAVRFGIAESIVYKLLKLGRLSPEVMQAFRSGKIDFAQVQAFTISDDIELQNSILDKVLNTSYRVAPHYIRSQLVTDEISAIDKRVRYVTIEFYEMCGGAVRRDLFDDSNSGYIQDAALINQLVESKLQTDIDVIKAEGWNWVEFVPEIDWKYISQFGCIKPKLRDFSVEETKELERLHTMLEQYDEEGVDEDDENKIAEIEQIQGCIEAIEKRPKEWSAEDKAISGVLVSLSFDGSLEIQYGLLKGGNQKQNSISNFAKIEQNSDELVRVKTEFSSALIRDLSSYRTAALRIELANRPDIALASVVYSLAIKIFYQWADIGNSVQIAGLHKSLNNTPADALEIKRKNINVPDNVDEFWSWCLERSREELIDILAVCAAYSVDAIQYDVRNKCKNIHHADKLAIALNLDMRKWFKPTAENLFSRISRNQILEAYREANGEYPSNSLLELKKKDLAARAEIDIGEKWLPSMLRSQEAQLE